jgi:hypothetical protein
MFVFALVACGAPSESVGDGVDGVDGGDVVDASFDAADVADAAARDAGDGAAADDGGTDVDADSDGAAAAEDADVVDAHVVDADVPDAEPEVCFAVANEPYSPEVRGLATFTTRPPRPDAGDDFVTLSPTTTRIVHDPAYVRGTTSDWSMPVRLLRNALCGLVAGANCDSTSHFRVLAHDDALVDEALSSGAVVIAVGRTRFSNVARRNGIWRDGYYFERDGNVIVIDAGGEGDALRVGRSRTPPPSGLFTGVSRFLEAVAGVRYYLPTSLWNTLPGDASERGEVRVGALDSESEPFIREVNTTGWEMSRGDFTWRDLNALADRRTGESDRAAGQDPDGPAGPLTAASFEVTHNIGIRFPAHVFFDDLPGGAPNPFRSIYPPLAGGTNYRPVDHHDQRWQPCLADPMIDDAAWLSIERHFEAFPADRYVSFVLNDTSGQCATDIDARTDLQGYADLYWGMLARVAERMAGDERFVGKGVLGYAYANTRLGPSFVLPPNVIVVSNLHTSELQGDAEPICGQTDAFLERATEYGNHFWMQGAGYLIPRVFTNQFAAFVANMSRWPVDARFAQFEVYPNWGLDGPKMWIASRVLWDPSVDPAVLRREFAFDMFGEEAGPDIDAYFACLEDAWIRLNHLDGIETGMTSERKMGNANSSSWDRQFGTTETSRAVLAECRGHLDDAGSHALSERQRQRLATFDKAFRVSEYLFEIERLREARIDNNALADEALAFVTREIGSDISVVASPHLIPIAINARRCTMSTGCR